MTSPGQSSNTEKFKSLGSIHIHNKKHNYHKKNSKAKKLMRIASEMSMGVGTTEQSLMTSSQLS